MKSIPGGLVEADDATLILIDYMPKLTLACTTLEPQILIGNAIGLAEVGAAFALPIITTGGRESDPYLPQVIEAAGPTRVHVERRSINSWKTPEFVDAVKRTGRQTLIMAGITTDLCLMLTALSARADGYSVQVVVDASGSFTRQIDDISLMRLNQAGVTLTTWASFAAELQGAGDWKDGVGPQIMKTFAKYHAGMGLIGAMEQHPG